MKKLLLLIAITFLSNTNRVFPVEYYSFSPYSNIGVNFNISRSSSGMSLDNFCPSCIDLHNGYGLGSNYGIGALNETHNSLINMRVQYGAYLDYNNHYSEFTNDKFLGNLISGNNIISGNVNYNLKVYLKTLEFVPFVYLYPVNNLNLAFKLGLNLGLNIGSKYDFSESTKDDNVFLKNGKKENNYSGSEFPGISNVNFSIPVGIKYDFQFKNIVVSPEVQYSFGLTKLHKESDWGLNTLKAGVSLVYKIDKQKRQPPVVAPPAPTLPKPSVQESNKSNDISSKSVWYINGNRMSSNDTIIIDNYETDFYDELPIIPYLFFTHNSAELQAESNLDEAEINVMENSEYIQQRFLKFLPEFAKQGKIKSVKILYTSDEVPGIGEKRIQFMKKFLSENNANINKIKFIAEKVEISTVKHPELLEENRAAIIDFKDTSNIFLSFLNSSTKEYPTFNNTVKIKPKTDYYLSNINGKIQIGDEVLANIESAETDFSLSLANLTNYNNYECSKMYLNYSLTNSADVTKNFVDSLNVLVNIHTMPNGINMKYTKLSDSTIYYEHVLALFDFDGLYIKFINNKGKSLLLQALAENKKIEIYGSADDFGTQEYNSALIDKRVDNVLREIKINPKKVTITKADKYPFDNSSPIGRMYNRAVMIRIYDKNIYHNEKVKFNH